LQINAFKVTQMMRKGLPKVLFNSNSAINFFFIVLMVAEFVDSIHPGRYVHQLPF